MTVTHPDMTRYFMSIREATELVLQAAVFGLSQQHQRGEILVLDMGEPVKIVDLARTMIAMSGRQADIDIPIVFTGMRPGEKLFEELFDPGETNEQAPEEGLILAKSRVSRVEELAPHIERIHRLAEMGDADGAIRELQQIVPDFPCGQPSMTLQSGARAPEDQPAGRLN